MSYFNNLIANWRIAGRSLYDCLQHFLKGLFWVQKKPIPEPPKREKSWAEIMSDPTWHKRCGRPGVPR